MGMPTDQELKLALAEAGRMRETGNDPHHVAKALLNLQYQWQQLEKVRQAAEQFLHSGMAATEHQRLARALKEVREAIDRTRANHGNNGLPL